MTAVANTAGYWGTNAGAVTITRSRFERNRAGVIVATSVAEASAPQAGTHLWGSTIADNNDRTVTRRGAAATLDVPRGVGVWIAGGWFDVVEANTVSGHDRYAIVASWHGTPAMANRIVRNTVHTSGAADLAWDGIGAGTCFGGNAGPDGGEPTSVPPQIQAVYDCALPATVGVPVPTVTTELLLASATRS